MTSVFFKPVRLAGFFCLGSVTLYQFEISYRIPELVRNHQHNTSFLFATQLNTNKIKVIQHKVNNTNSTSKENESFIQVKIE